jgi:hypothetical protein
MDRSEFAGESGDDGCTSELSDKIRPVIGSRKAQPMVVVLRHNVSRHGSTAL